MRNILYVILSSFAVFSGLLLLMISFKTQRNRITNFLAGMFFTVVGLGFIYLILSGRVVIPGS